MRRAPRLFVLPALALVLACFATAARAGEALEALRGVWQVETFDGEAAPAGVTLLFDFVDDDTLKVTFKAEGEEDVQEIRYTATADGKITVYPPEAPEGDQATWQVKPDGKLYITTDDGDAMVLKRP